MKKKFLSLLLLVCVALSSLLGLTGCDLFNKGSETIEEIDYAGQVTLDLNSTSTVKLEVTMKYHIDGDTTHFNVPESVDKSKVMKARYQGVNTPESTGKIEEWGKKASAFTKEKLTGASSIYVEGNKAEWEHDANGRFLVWVWYKAEGAENYRNLNIELLQEGLAVGSKTEGSLYGEICDKAISQAKALSKPVYSGAKDPDYCYNGAMNLSLKELRLNPDAYVGQRVAFDGVVSAYNNWVIYVEDLDEETGIMHALPVFYGYEHTYHPVLKPGNRVHIAGNFEYSETYGYQVSNLKYDPYDLSNPENIQKLESGLSGAFTEYTVAELEEKVTLDGVEHKKKDLAIYTSVSMKNLTVTDMYTTDNGGDSDGAITITCKDADDNVIKIRTSVLKDAQGNLITEAYFEGKTISFVKGIYNTFTDKNGDVSYQINVFTLDNFVLA